AHSLVPAAAAVADGAPTWLPLGWDRTFVANAVWTVPGGRQIAIDGHDGVSQAHILRGDGFEDVYRWPTRERMASRPLTQLMPIGRACAAFAGGDWWVVDPEFGVLKSATPHDWVPAHGWMGITSSGGDELVLAAVDQRIVVLDLATR